MKKKTLLSSFLLLTFMSMFLIAPKEVKTVKDKASVFSLPAFLIEIGDSAFENTAAEAVIIPDSTVILGNRAFANNKVLRNVQIPNTVLFIGENAFAESIHVRIQGIENSYAKAWARVHNVPFVEEENAPRWFTKLKNVLLQGCFLSWSIGYICPELQYWQCRKRERREISMRPQDRTELYPINYKFP